MYIYYILYIYIYIYILYINILYIYILYYIYTYTSGTYSPGIQLGWVRWGRKNSIQWPADEPPMWFGVFFPSWYSQQQGDHSVREKLTCVVWGHVCYSKIIEGSCLRTQFLGDSCLFHLISALRGGRIKQSEKATEWRKWKLMEMQRRLPRLLWLVSHNWQGKSRWLLMDLVPSEDVDGDPLEPANNAAQS